MVKIFKSDSNKEIIKIGIFETNETKLRVAFVCKDKCNIVTIFNCYDEQHKKLEDIDEQKDQMSYKTYDLKSEIIDIKILNSMYIIHK
jgi:hypothetical protein